MRSARRSSSSTISVSMGSVTPSSSTDTDMSWLAGPMSSDATVWREVSGSTIGTCTTSASGLFASATA